MYLDLQDIKKVYPGSTEPVIEHLNLGIKDGSFTVLLGPSGCGKTTLLRMIAGLESVTGGSIVLEGDNITNMEPGERNLAMVFQNYAIYPHMTVKGNIEFGLKNYEMTKAQREERIKLVIELTGLNGFEDRMPNQLSGGQRQRVALARAISKSPKAFLMDEPLSNLDAKLRTQMRSELIQLYNKMNTTFIYVTHDQTEALTMATDIVVMKDGVIMQYDTPENIYANPANVFVAQFIGDPGMNVIRTEDGRFIGFKPRAVTVEDGAEGVRLPGKLLTKEYLGVDNQYTFAYGENGTVVMRSTKKLNVGEDYELTVPLDSVYYFDEDQNRCDPFEIVGLAEVFYADK